MMIQHFLVQWIHLIGRAGEVLVLGLVAGWSITLLFLPYRFVVRWIVFTPVVGMAALTVIGLPLSLSGIPVNTFALPVVLGLAASGLVATMILRHRHPVLRSGRAFAYLRSRGARLLLLAGIVTALSTYLMTAQARSDIGDYWGSGDLAAYWTVSDFLLNYGGTYADYVAQSEFRSVDVHDHIVSFARLGNMVYLAIVAGVLDPSRVHRVMNPTIVTMMLLIVALGLTWLESMRCRPLWPLLIAACHPFLYFLLYFSYASQATGVVLTFTGFVVAREAMLRPMSRTSARLGGIVGGLFFAAALLHYPVLPPLIGAILAVLWFTSLRSPAKRHRSDVMLGLGLSLLAFTFYYIPSSWRELTLLRTAPLPGWNWQRPIAFSEIAGLRTVLGYGLPSPLATGYSWTLEFFGGTLLVGGVALAWFGRRDRIVTFTLGGFTLAAAANALLQASRHVPNASHSYVKAISFFAIILLLAGLAGWAQFFERLPRPVARTAIAFLLTVWIPCELRALRFGSYQEPRYRESLIELTRRQTARGAHVWFASWPPNDDQTWQAIQDPLAIQPIAPIVRNVEWLDPARGGSARAVKISDAGRPIFAPVIDAAPGYVVTDIATESRPHLR